MKRIFLLILTLLPVVLVGCKHQSEPPITKVRRTVVVYMEGRNNLSANAYDDLDEMRRAVIPDDCRLVVYRSISGENHPMLMEIYSGKDSVLVNYAPEASAVDPTHMARVLADVDSVAPSDEKGIVFWSHSSGWRQKSPPLSRGYGLEYSYKQMSISDLAAALQGRKTDFIIFDTCYMGSVEVAYELRNAAPRMVASVCEVPAPGMPYNLIVEHLFDTDIDRGLTSVIDLTVDYYTERHNSSDPKVRTSVPSTLSLIDLTRVDEIAGAIKPIIRNPLGGETQLQRFATSSPYNELFFDLGQYMEALGDTTGIVGSVVLHERHTEYPIWGRLQLNRCSGLSVYVPQINPPNSYKSYDYHTLAWARFLGLQ